MPCVKVGLEVARPVKLAVGIAVMLTAALGTWGQAPLHDPGPPLARADQLLRFFQVMCVETGGGVREAQEAATRAGWYPLVENEEGYSTYSPVVQHPRAGGVYFPSHLTIWEYPDEVRCEVGTSGGPEDQQVLRREAERWLGRSLRAADDDSEPWECDVAPWEGGQIAVCYFQGVEGAGVDIALVVPKFRVTAEAETS